MVLQFKFLGLWTDQWIISRDLETILIANAELINSRAVFKTGMGTLGREGRDAGTSNIGDVGEVGDKCDISSFVKMCYLWSTLDPLSRTTSDTLWCLHIIFRCIGVSALTNWLRLSTVRKHLLLDLRLKICKKKYNIATIVESPVV